MNWSYYKRTLIMRLCIYIYITIEDREHQEKIDNRINKIIQCAIVGWHFDPAFNIYNKFGQSGSWRELRLLQTWSPLCLRWVLHVLLRSWWCRFIWASWARSRVFSTFCFALVKVFVNRVLSACDSTILRLLISWFDSLDLDWCL